MSEPQPTPRPLTLRDRLMIALFAIIGVPLSLLMLYLLVRSIDPPRHVNESVGTILSWGASNDPEVVLHYYKMKLFVRIDDGRTVSVASTRTYAPKAGDRVRIQERIGWLGTRHYVELPDT